MPDQEFNEKIKSLISMVQVGAVLSKCTIDEYLGKWDELTESREDELKSYQLLFSIDNDDLTAENQAEIAQLRKEAYPMLLCQLSKCYLIKERYSDAKEILREAIELGSVGAQVLFGMALIDGQETDDDVSHAFAILKEVDILSDTVTEQVNNDRFQAAAQLNLATLYRVVANDLAASYDCLLRVVNSAWDDDLKETARQRLGNFKKGFFGKLQYKEKG